MKIGLIDVDGHRFPNLPLMKLSAWHKRQGDQVEWYSYWSGHYDKIYMSKVFSFTPDYDYPINADEVIRGGVVTASNWWTVVRFITRSVIRICRRRSNTASQTIPFTTS